jgi:hypothetical protein
MDADQCPAQLPARDISLSRRWAARFGIALLSALGIGDIAVGAKLAAAETLLSRSTHRQQGQPQAERRERRARGKKRHRKSCQPPRERCGRRCCQPTGGNGACSPACRPGETSVDGSCQGERCGTPCTTSLCGAFPAGCPLFPESNIWNRAIESLDVLDNSDELVASIGVNTSLHPDFGAGLYEGQPIGIPFVTVPVNQPLVPVHFGDYGDESDPGPYPIPPDAPVEGGACSDGDRHVLVVQAGTCQLYELFNARSLADGSWLADSAAHFDLDSNDLRPEGWTSADAAGLPILPGLIRYEEVAAGAIEHALRFTAQTTRRDYVWPARHQAGATNDANVPAMGERFRLNADFDISSFSPANQVILTALKTYGMILADNGGDWFISGAPDEQWNNDDLNELKRVHGSDFAAVDCSSLMVDSDSGEAS